MVPGENQTQNIIEEIQQQQLQRGHGEKGQKYTGNHNRKDVAKIGGGRDFDILGHIGKGPAALLDSCFQHTQVLFQQDHIRPFSDSLRRGVHRYAHIRLCNGRQVVHPVPQKAHRVSVGPEVLHDLYLLFGG